MNKTFKILTLVAALCLLAACGKEDKAADTGPVVLTAPTTADDAAWRIYLTEVVKRNMEGVPNSPFLYYLPAAPAGTPMPPSPSEASAADVAPTVASNDTTPPAADAAPAAQEPLPDSPEAVYERLLGKVSTDVERTVVPGNMLVFASPDSARMATLIETAFQNAEEGTMQGVRVLFIGNAQDSDRVKAAVEASSAEYRFFEAK